MAIRVVLVDDHEIVRDGMKAVLEREGFEIVGEASDGHTAVRTVGALRPDVAVIDVAMPLLNGIDASREIGVLYPATRVILLTMHTDAPYVLEAFRAGVNFYTISEFRTRAELASSRGPVLKKEAVRNSNHSS